MRYRQTPLAVIALGLVAALVGCSSGSKTTTTPPPVIGVSVSGAPASLVVNSTAPITATVTNDSANGGVTWTCAPSGSCGTFAPTSTASGAATTYTAPGAAGSVTVTATSVTDTTKSASATISVTTPPIALADGSYVFSLAGSDGNAALYNAAGVFTVSGGAITGGEQDFVDGINSDLHDAINATGSGFTTTTDGNLQITLVTCLGQTCTSVDPAVGGGTGIEVINGSVVSASTCGTAGGPCRARLVEFDTFATSSGTLELQNATAAVAAPVGTYAFGIQGVPFGSLALGGILNISSTSVSTTGTIFDLNAQGTGTTLSAETISAGTVTAPDTTGRFQIGLTPTDSADIGPINFAAYIVDANHIQLVEATSPLGGVAYLQGTTLTVDGNSYVVGLTGENVNGAFQAAGALTLTPGGTPGSGTVTGSITYNDLVSEQSSSAPITAGTYVADATGRVTLSGVTDGVLINPLTIQLYVDGNGNVLSITMDTTDVLGGVGYLQTAGATFSGTYVMDATGADFTNEFELDAVGPVTTGSGTFSGFADLNWLSTGTAATQSTDLTVTGAFTAPAGGVSTGTGNTLTGLDVVLGTGQADAFDYYVVDANHVIAIETDINQLTLGFFELTQ